MIAFLELQPHEKGEREFLGQAGAAWKLLGLKEWPRDPNKEEVAQFPSSGCVQAFIAGSLLHIHSPKFRPSAKGISFSFPKIPSFS